MAKTASRATVPPTPISVASSGTCPRKASARQPSTRAMCRMANSTSLLKLWKVCRWAGSSWSVSRGSRTMSAMTISSVDFQETLDCRAGCAGGTAGQYHDLMKLIVSALMAFLLASSPLAAQNLEADMKQAAGAYERKDMATAVRIWKTWAGKGNAEARTLLGAMYWSGEGVPRDHKEAARLYLLAANQGYARAQNDIGFMLGFGEGIPPPDDIEAYKW